MKFKKYHKIKQFRDVIRDIQFQANYKGLDNEGNPIQEETTKPILTFKGTVKLHGTNASVYYTPEGGIRAGKRNSGLSPEQLTEHMGFNQFVQVTKKGYFKELLKNIHLQCMCNDKEQVIVYGEWAGMDIQKGVGISLLPKSFYIFDIAIYNEEDEEYTWVDIDKIDIPAEDNIYKITDFLRLEVEIDFNNPELSQNELIKFTTKVEEECPVAKQLGVSGIGEGIVWKTEWKNKRYIFKVKGDKHSTSKVKKLASIDPELLKSINEFIDYACTVNRIEQGIKEVDAKEKSDIPNLIRWVANDIIAEEDDVLKANSLKWKQVAKDITTKIRQYYFKKLDTK